jgi:hypothetical protein
MMSFGPRTSHRRYDDSDNDLSAEYAWLDDYPAEGDWVWEMEPSRLRLLSRLHDYELDSD